MPCPDPESARSVLISCVGVAIDQALLCGVAADRLILQPVESFFQCADPEISLPVFIEMPGRDRNSPVGADELKGSLKARTNVHFQGLVVGSADRHFPGRAGGNHVAHVVRGDPDPLSVDGLKPECSTLIERRAPEVIFQDLPGQRKVDEAPMGKAVDPFMLADPESC